MPLTNPYNPDGTLWRELSNVQAKIDPKDIAFLESVMPFRRGVQDKILSTLFHQFINELRNTINTNNAGGALPLEPAWHPGHPTESILLDVLHRCDPRNNPRVHGGGTPGPRDDGPTASGLRPEVHSPAPERPDTESSTPDGVRRKPGRTKKKAEVQGEGQRNPGAGTPGPTDGATKVTDLLKQIKKL